MRRLRTHNAPYISILSIGVEEITNEQPILALSCGILTSEIRIRFAAIEAIHLTTYANEFLIDALDKDRIYLGSLVRQDLEFASQIHATLKRRLEDEPTIHLRLFSILKPLDYITKGIRSVLTQNTSFRFAA